ncbi:DUF4198 domain-containing protein [Brevibacillus sp. SYSU BS000544]|uniref:DUF4198 domain-containing protein n=1 Tax=Brevibacillus sp. SYSU BS000544 TaxID=3416443 RepID=UPI003CE4855F
MKKIASLLTGLALTFSLAVPVFAHDGWAQTNSPIVSSGEVSYVELLLGNHSNEHKSYRIEGKWSTPTSKVFVSSPSGVKTEITSTLFYTGETGAENPGVNNSYIASFSSSSPGAYIVTVEGDSIFKHGEAASRTLRSAKSFVAVSDVATTERVKYLKGFSKQVSPDRAELVPLFNPVAVTPGQKVEVQLFLKGKPLADSEISIIRRSNSNAQVLKTDANGKISFATGPADYYLMRTKPATDEKVAGQYDSTNYEATMTFTVQNGKGQILPATAASVPYVYVNGKLTPVQGLTLSNGKALVPASFITTAIDPSFKGNGQVELKATAESLGATVEYLAPVGSLQPAILINKTTK